ncbi:MAG: VanZ family protein [Gemmatimonadota bacterium]|nr:VanZ family protein [Gemmatimonadota bacterium]
MPEPRTLPRLLAIGHEYWPRALAYLWFPTLYLVTLTPTPSFRRPGPEPFMWCLLCGDRGGADLLLNVAMFVPLGLLAARRLGVWRTFLLGAGLSAGIEMAQLFLPGRFSTLADLVANGSGALAGALLYTLLAALGRGARPGPAVGTAAAVVAGGLVLLGGWLVAPSPTDEAYWGQWTPYFGPGTRYPGTVLDARFNGHPFPSGKLPDSLRAREAMRDDWTLVGTVEKGPRPGWITSVLSIYDGRQDEILYLGAYREHLLLRERLRAQDWHLDRPELVAWDILAPVAEGDTMRVSARRAGSDRCLAVDEREVCGLGFTTGRLWSLLLYPASAPRWMRALADFGVLFTLFLPLGLLAPSARGAVLNAAVASGLIAFAVASTRLSFDWLLEPFGALSGLALGYAAAWALRWAGDELATRASPPTSSGSA